MGIKDFYKYIRDHHPEIMVEVSYEALSYQRCAIDMMNVMYTSKARTAKARSQTAWMDDVLQFLHRLRMLYIHPICVFDGRTHPQKQETTDKRKREKSKYLNRALQLRDALDLYCAGGHVSVSLNTFIQSKPGMASLLSGKPNVNAIREYIERQVDAHSLGFTDREVNAIKELVEAMGLQVLTAHYDGEALCAALNKEGQVDVVLSNDSDVFMFGAETVVCKFTQNGGYLVRRADLLDALEVDEDEFLRICIASGTDFNDGVKGVRFTTAVKRRYDPNLLPKPLLKSMLKTLGEIADAEGYTVQYARLYPRDEDAFQFQCMVWNLNPDALPLQYPLSELVFEEE